MFLSPFTTLPIATLAVRAALAFFLLIGLAACGGGGSSAKTPGAGGLPASSLLAQSSVNSSIIASSSVSSLAVSSLSSSATSIASSVVNGSEHTAANTSSFSSALSSSALGSSAADSLSSSSSSFTWQEPDPSPCPAGLYRFDGHNCTYSNVPMPVYIPAADEVVIYVNSKEKDFAGYSIFLWSDCGDGWADTQTDGTSIFTAPYEWVHQLGVTTNIWTGVAEDPLYGAYFILKTKPAGACGNFIIRSPGLTDQTIDLNVDITYTDNPLERMIFVVESPEGLRKSSISSLPVCVNDLYPLVCKSWQEVFPEGSSSSSAPAAVIHPQGLVSDGGNLYVTDANHSIVKITVATGAATLLAGSPGNTGSQDGVGSAALFNNPRGMVSDGTSLYLADSDNRRIRKIDIASGATTSLNLTPSFFGSGCESGLASPMAIASDGGDLYVADSASHRICKILLATGELSTAAGSGVLNMEDFSGSEFVFPQGVAANAGNLYVVDTGHHAIRKIVIASGEITTLAGLVGTSGAADGAGPDARFFWPQAIASDDFNLYVADNGAIRKIVIATGVVTTLAGLTNTSGSVDGVGSAARFDDPRSIAIEGGNLYVSDRFSIRKIVIASGEVTTFKEGSY